MVGNGVIKADLSLSVLTQKSGDLKCCYYSNDSLEKLEDVIVGSSTIVMIDEWLKDKRTRFVFRLNMPVYSASFDYKEGYGYCGSVDEEIDEPIRAVEFLVEVIRGLGNSFPIMLLEDEVKVGDCIEPKTIGKIRDMILLGNAYQFLFTSNYSNASPAIVKYSLDDSVVEKVEDWLGDFWRDIRKSVLHMHSVFKQRVMLNVDEHYCWLNLDFTESFIAIDYGKRIEKIKMLKEYKYFDNVLGAQKLSPFCILSFPEEIVVIDSDNVIERFTSPIKLLEVGNMVYIRSFILKNRDKSDIVLLTPAKITVKRR